MHNRTVFLISDGTGITAETFAKAILNQFEAHHRLVRLPFTDSVDKAHNVVREINHTAQIEGYKPIMFTTLANEEVMEVIRSQSHGFLLDMFSTFVAPLEVELGIKSNHRVGRFSDASKAANTTTVRPSIFRWPTTTGKVTVTWRAPMSFWWA